MSDNHTLPQPAQPDLHYHYNVKQFNNGMPIAAMVLGICTFVTFGATGILALIFGIIGLDQVKEGKADNKGAAVTGIVLGGLACAGWSLWIVFILIASSGAGA